jgi:hypothetical protein
MRKKPLAIFSLIIATLLVVFVGIPYYRDAQLPRATAVLEIHEPEIGCFLRTGPGSSGTNHFEETLSPETLSSAIQILNLGLPATEEEIAFLKTQLKISPVRGSNFIEVIAKYQSQEQATLIANAVAEAYVTRQEKTERLRADRAIKALDEEIQTHTEVTEEIRSKFVITCKRFGLDDPFIRDTLPDAQEMEKAYHVQIRRDHPRSEVSYDMEMVHHEFQATKEEYLQSSALLREMKIQQLEPRAILKAHKSPVSIQKPAK